MEITMSQAEIDEIIQDWEYLMSIFGSQEKMEKFAKNNGFTYDEPQAIGGIGYLTGDLIEYLKENNDTPKPRIDPLQTILDFGNFQLETI